MSRAAGPGRAVLLATTLVGGLAVCLAGCSTGQGIAAGPPPLAHGSAAAFVAVGDGPAGGGGDPRAYWPALVSSAALPPVTVTYVVAVPPGWVGAGAGSLAAEVLARHPGVVAIALGGAEAQAGVSPADFSDSLSELLGDLQASRARVLVANLPLMPGENRTLLGEYDSEIAHDAGHYGDTLVDVGKLAAVTSPTGASIGSGWVLSAGGEYVEAEGFEAALREHPPRAPANR